MRCSTLSTLMMVALIGDAVAGPTHAHFHPRAHQKKNFNWDSLDWPNMDIDWKSAYQRGKNGASVAAGPVATPAVAASNIAEPAKAAEPVKADEPVKAAEPTKAADAASSAADSVSAGSILSEATDDISTLWKGLVGVSNRLKSFGSPTAASGNLGDHYRGNFGSPYGSNMMKVRSASGYNFTNTFINTGRKSMTINIWNKVGPDYQDLSGSALAPKKTTLTFTLKPGQSQIVAFQDNTQAAWAEACDDFAASGAYATVWGEVQYRSQGSGFNYSAIMSKGSNNYNMTITSKENSCVSSQNENYWLTDTQPIGSNGSCYVPGSSMHLTTKMGGVMSY